MMKKKYLLTPGPTAIPDSVLAVFSKQIIHHRTHAFEEVMEEVRHGLKYLFQTQQEVFILTTSGTGAMEAAVSNLFCRGDAVVSINGGKFGERWSQIARAFGLEVIEIRLNPGEAVSPSLLDETLHEAFRKNVSVKGVLFQASETSTGVQMPTEEICNIARKHGILSVCDAITACGVIDLPMDKWGLDVLITGSQKALMMPPGLAIIAFSDRAWASAEKSNLPHFNFNLLKERKAITKNQTCWTPAISLTQGLQVSLKMIQEEGLQNVFKRHDLLARATRNSVQALGLEMLAKTSPSTAVTAVCVPPQIQNGKHIPQLMEEKYGVTIAGGQDELEGKIFRLSHIGYCDRFDITTGISALELVLSELGYPVQFGHGVGAALKTFAEG